jgi:hypothetical protein
MMPENWSSIAAEIATAMRDVGFPVTLQATALIDPASPDPVHGEPNEYEVHAIDDQIKRRDGNGTITETVRVLTVEASGVVPVKGWNVVVNCKRHRIAQVWPLALGGVDLLYDLELEA